MFANLPTGLMLFFAGAVVLHGEPKIKGPSSAHIYEGETATLNCMIKGLDPNNPNYTFTWKRDGHFIGFDQRRYCAVGPCTYDGDNYTYKLIVENVNDDDTNVDFTCHISHLNTSYESQSARINITKVPKGKPQCYLEGAETTTHTMNPGESITTTCRLRIDGHDPRLHWKRNNRFINGARIESHLPDIRDKWIVHENDNNASIECIYTETETCSLVRFKVNIYDIKMTVDNESSADDLVFACFLQLNGVRQSPGATYLWIVDNDLIQQTTGRYEISNNGQNLTIKSVSDEDHKKVVHCIAQGDNINIKQTSYKINRPPPQTTTVTPTTRTSTTLSNDPDPIDVFNWRVAVICLCVLVGILLAMLVAVVICWKYRSLPRRGDDICYANGALVIPKRSEDCDLSTTDGNGSGVTTPTAQLYNERENELHYDSCDVTKMPGKHDCAKSVVYVNGENSICQNGKSSSGAYEVVKLDASAMAEVHGESNQVEPVYKSLKRDEIQPSYTSLASITKSKPSATPNTKVRQKPLKLPLHLPKSLRKNKGGPKTKPKPAPRPRTDKDSEENHKTSANTGNKYKQSNQAPTHSDMAAWKVMP